MRFYFDEVEELVDDEEDFVEEEELVDDEEELERFFEFLSKNLFLLSRLKYKTEKYYLNITKKFYIQ